MKNPKLQLSSIIPKVCEAARLASMRTTNTLRSPSFPPEPLERCVKLGKHTPTSKPYYAATVAHLRRPEEKAKSHGFPRLHSLSADCARTCSPCVICECADIHLEIMWILRALLTHGWGAGLCQQKHRRSRPRQIQAQPKICHPRT